MRDLGACAVRPYLERGQLVTVEVGWRGKGPRNVLIRRADGTRVVRPFRGLRRTPDASTEPDTHGLSVLTLSDLLAT